MKNYLGVKSWIHTAFIQKNISDKITVFMLDCSLQLHGFFWLYQIEFMLPGLAQRPFVISPKDSSSIAHQNNLQLWQEQFIKDPLKQLHFRRFLPVTSLRGVRSRTLLAESSAPPPPPRGAARAASPFLLPPSFSLESCNYAALPAEPNNLLIS